MDTDADADADADADTDADADADADADVVYAKIQKGYNSFTLYSPALEEAQEIGYKIKKVGGARLALS